MIRNKGKKARLKLDDEIELKKTLNSDPCYAAAALMTVIAINEKVSEFSMFYMRQTTRADVVLSV